MEIVAECLEAAEVEREWVVALAAVAETDFAPRGLFERTEAERARPLATVVVELVAVTTVVVILPSLPDVR